MNPSKSQRWKKVLGTTMLVVPLLTLVPIPFLGVVLGSLGMDIHWNGSRPLLYLTVAGVAIALSGCFAVDWRLRSQGRVFR